MKQKLNLDVLNRLVDDLNAAVKEHDQMEDTPENRMNIVSTLTKTIGTITGITVESGALIKDMTIIFQKYCTPPGLSGLDDELNSLISFASPKSPKIN